MRTTGYSSTWQRNGENLSKTVCYSDEEEKLALERFHTADDFYSNYDQAIVNYRENIFEYDHINQHRKRA